MDADQSPKDYSNWSTKDLIARVTALESKLRAHNISYSSPTSPPPAALKKKPKKPPKAFDPSKYSTRFIALKFTYLGGRYNGFEHHTNNTTPLPTIEEELWRALRKTKLIFPKWKDGQSEDEVCWDGVDYSKCGRTDRGVSAFGQVVGLRVRSSKPKEKMVEAAAGPEDDDAMVDAGPASDSDEAVAIPPWDFVKDELPYIQLLNRVLPPDIKVLAWCPEPPADFSARFSCKERRYRYFFSNPAFVPLPEMPKRYTGSAWLDVEAMQVAAQKLEGLHDFRNMCKVDPSKQITNFERRIFSAKIEKVSADQGPGAFLARSPFTSSASSTVPSSAQPELYYFEVRGSAFLWHQVRHLVAALFLVGQGYEAPSIVDDLLDVQKVPSKPKYEMADDRPLVLWDCIFPDLDKVAQENHADGAHASAYVDTLDWVYVGDDIGGRDTAKRLDAAVGTGKFGRNGIMDDLWAQWRQRKMDELLAGSLMDVVARQPMRSSTYQNGSAQPADAESARVFDGSETPRAVGTYVPLMQRERTETPDVVNARYAMRKGLDPSRAAGRIAVDDMDE